MLLMSFMQNNNEKVAFFDFCETLTNFQTADAFVNYVREITGNCRAKKWERFRRFLCDVKVISLLSYIFPGKSIHKRLVLYQLKGYSQDILHEFAVRYYMECVKPGFISATINRLRELKNDGYKVGLVSGGYDIYLDEFAEEFNLDFVISSRIGFEKGLCTGRMSGLDCLDNNKIKLIKQFFKKKPAESIAFSDSKSDIPLLQYADTGVVVSHSKHQNWVDNYKLEEIIWE